MGSYSLVQCLRHLMGQPLYCSTVDVGLWGERGYSDGSTTYTWLSSIALLRWLPGFPPQAFSSQSPPSPPLDPSLHSQQQPSSWAPSPCAHSPNSSSQPLCLPGDQHSCPGYVWLWQGLSWVSFHLGCHRSAVSLSALNVSPPNQTIAPMWGLDPSFSSPTCWGQVQSY